MTKFINNLIKKDLAIETSFSLPDIWDYEGQKRYLEKTANSMNMNLGEIIFIYQYHKKHLTL